MTLKRVSTGIIGLDELIEGGFPVGANVLIEGGPGSGKTIFGLQFIVHGAINGEPGIYFTAEESKNKILGQAEQFNWDLKKLENENKCAIYTISEYDIEAILALIEEGVKRLKAKRVVVDSLSMLSICSKVLDKVEKALTKEDLLHKTDVELSRSQIVGILRKLNDLETTNIIICEGKEVAGTVAEYAADGVIFLGINEAIGTRSLSIVKMRETRHPLEKINIQITKDGIVVVRRQ